MNKQLENRLKDWIVRHRVRTEECIYQSDRVQEGLYELGEIVCEELGYWDEEGQSK